MTDSLEARVQRLEDIEAIRQLKAEYCDICDDSHNPDRIVTIFTEDGVWEGKGIATATYSIVIPPRTTHEYYFKYR